MAGISRLDARFPAWDLLMLGGRPVSGNRAPRTGNGPVGVKGVHAAECVYQSHGYVVRATAFDSIKEKLAQGFVADNALVSYQGRFAGSRAFRRRPPLMSQRAGAGSDLLYSNPAQTGRAAHVAYAAAFKAARGAGGVARRPARLKKVLGRRGRGTAAIGRRARKASLTQQTHPP